MCFMKKPSCLSFRKARFFCLHRGNSCLFELNSFFYLPYISNTFSLSEDFLLSFRNHSFKKKSYSMLSSFPFQSFVLSKSNMCWLLLQTSEELPISKWSQRIAGKRWTTLVCLCELFRTPPWVYRPKSAENQNQTAVGVKAPHRR